MPAARYDFSKITQGDTLLEVFQFNADADGTPYDLTGATFATQFRTGSEDQGGTLVIDAASYWTISTPATGGQATLEIPDSVTAAIDTSSVGVGETYYLYYDIEITNASGQRFTWLTGRLPVAPQVTA